MNQFFQISEEDLSDLERIIPDIINRIVYTDPRMRTQARRVKDILSNVRWEYGPHECVEEYEEDEEEL